MDWKQLVGSVAPTLATALGGPLAGLAVKAIAEQFGVEATPEAVAEAVQGASAEQLIALKQLDVQFAQIGLDSKKADYADTANARQRDIDVSTSPNAPYLNKIIAPLLALIVVVGGGLLLVYAEEPDVRMAAVSIMTMIIGFYFGTTAGKVKDSQALRDVVNQRTTP